MDEQQENIRLLKFLEEILRANSFLAHHCFIYFYRYHRSLP